jgi:hypothetical protein
MDFSTPISTVVPSLDGPVLQVLARAGKPLSGRQVHALTGSGSVAGVRLVLQRLASTGLMRLINSPPVDLDFSALPDPATVHPGESS